MSDRFVQPEVFFVGATAPYEAEVRRYLERTDQMEFFSDWHAAKGQDIPGGMALCSLFAKICYASLVPGRNANVEKTRDIKTNLERTFDAGHGSVFEHCNLNFVVTDCSRIFTHELVRHRAGTAFSQTSGRYVRLDDLKVVWDPILDPVKDLFDGVLRRVEDAVYLAECRLGLRKPPDLPDERSLQDLVTSDPAWPLTGVDRAKYARCFWVPDYTFPMDKRKKITSAIRRIAPNGQANEIAVSLNIRALRHAIQLRTAPGAEWEIRSVFGQVYHLVRMRFPLIFYRARTRIVDDLLHVYGMKQQPYEVDLGDPNVLQFWSADALRAELAGREANSEISPSA